MNRVLFGRILIGTALIPSFGCLCWLSDPGFQQSLLFLFAMLPIIGVLILIPMVIVIANILYRLLFGKWVDLDGRGKSHA